MNDRTKTAALIGGGGLLLVLLASVGKRKASAPGAAPVAVDNGRDVTILPPADEGSSIRRGDADVLRDDGVPPPIKEKKAKPTAPRKPKGATVPAPERHPRKTKLPERDEEQLWRDAATRAYQTAKILGLSHVVASAKALDMYLNQGGTNGDVIRHWQRQIGVAPSGVADNETTARLEELL